MLMHNCGETQLVGHPPPTHVSPLDAKEVKAEPAKAELDELIL